jgi:hypothetical protein
MDCSICANPLNKGNRQKVECGACNLVACKECVRQYLSTSTSLPHCMGCKTRFTHHFLVRHLNRSWMQGAYKETLGSILTGKQIGLLPETQSHVEFEIHKRKIEKQTIGYRLEIRRLQERTRKLDRAVRANGYILRGEPVPEMFINEYVTGHDVRVDPQKKFIMSCPLDGCRGFLSTQYKCGTCQKSICSDCLCLKQDEHECVESDRLSAEMIKKETRPCPTCGTRIHKIDGCDQMYCTSIHNGVHCNTAFSWRTLQIEKNVHNPHYYELMRKTGVQFRNVGDVQCGGMPGFRPVSRFFDAIHDHWPAEPVRVYLARVHRRLSELVQYTTTTFRERVQSHETTMRGLRVKYMMNEMSKELFAETIYKTEILHQKTIDVQQILELITISGIESFISISEQLPLLSLEQWHHLFREEPELPDRMLKHIRLVTDNLNSVREYCNEQLKQISITYNCTVQEYGNQFDATNVKYKMSGEKI